VDHDFSARICSALLGSAGEIECIRIINPQAEMKLAVRVKLANAVDTFRHLPVALATFRPGHATGRENGIRADEARLTCGLCRVDFQQALLFETEQRDTSRWIGNSRGAEFWLQALAHQFAVFSHAIFNRFQGHVVGDSGNQGEQE